MRPAGQGGPGPNHWSDSADNVRLEGSDLVLSIVKDAAGNWTSAEVGGRRHLGYGTFRWVITSDLSRLDSHEVLGMFTYGGSAPSHNEIDIEPSHWGNLAWASGTATVWRDAAAGRRLFRTFNYSDRPPYVNQFTWEPGRIHWLVVDGTGTRLLELDGRPGRTGAHDGGPGDELLARRWRAARRGGHHPRLASRRSDGRDQLELDGLRQGAPRRAPPPPPGCLRRRPSHAARRSAGARPHRSRKAPAAARRLSRRPRRAGDGRATRPAASVVHDPAPLSLARYQPAAGQRVGADVPSCGPAGCSL